MTPPLRPDRVAAIQARYDAATPGHWHLNPEPHTDPDAVRTTVSGWHHGIGVLQFRGWKAAENREFVLNARDDVGQLLNDRELYADRANLVARIGDLELALGGAVGMLFSASVAVNAGLLPDLDKLRQGTEELRRIQYAGTKAGAVLTVFRTSHPESGITLGTYRSREAAMGHVHHVLANEENTSAAAIELRVIWRADDPDEDEPVWECWLVDADGADDSPTGYVVTPITVATAYDPDGDE